MTPSPRRYRRIYDLVADRPGLTLAQYARLLPGTGHTGLKDILAHMDYYGYLLMEGERGDLYPFRIVEGWHDRPLAR